MVALHKLGNGTPSLVALLPSTRTCQNIFADQCNDPDILTYTAVCRQDPTERKKVRGEDDAPGTEAGSAHRGMSEFAG